MAEKDRIAAGDGILPEDARRADSGLEGRDLRRRALEWEILSLLSRSFVSRDTSETLRLLKQEIPRLLNPGSGRVRVMFYPCDVRRGTVLFPLCHDGAHGAYRDWQEFATSGEWAPLGDYPYLAKVAESGTACIYHDVKGHPDFEGVQAMAAARGLRARAVIPVRHRDSMLGFLVISYHDDKEGLAEAPRALFDPREIAFFEELANLVGLGYAQTLADEQRQASEAQFRTLAESIAAMVCIRVGSKFVYVNPAFVEMSGYTREELLAMDAWEIAHPEGREYIRERIRLRDAGDAAVTRDEARLKKKDGTDFWVEVCTAPLDLEGRKASIITAHDVTQRKQAAATLSRRVMEQEALALLAQHQLARLGGELTSPMRAEVYRLLESRFGHHGMTFFPCDEGAGRVGFQESALRWNEFFQGVSWQAMSAHPYIESVVRTRRPHIADDVRVDPLYNEYHQDVLRRRGVISRAELPVLFRDEVVGVLVFSLFSDGPTASQRGLFDEDDIRFFQRAGAIFGLNCVQIRMEHEQRKLEAQLQQSQKLESLGVLAGGIAHDFNNLLTSILGNASLAQMDLPPVASARESLEQIEKAAMRATDLCKQMLAYSGKGRFEIVALDLSVLVEDMLKLLELSISKKALLRLDLASDLPRIDADATQLRQVVMNLITNASDAIGERSGVIRIVTSFLDCDESYLRALSSEKRLLPGAYVCLEVSDTGCGMPPETISRMFDPFFTTKATGRGLGLAAVLGIVRGHGGALKVYSEPGKGTTFKILFPKGTAATALPEDLRRTADAWLGSGTVLVADDEDSVRTLAARMMKRLGYEVVVAVDGREAVEKFREGGGDFALVLLDITMPRLSGEEAYREMRKIRADARVLLTSGYNEQEIAPRFAGKGVAGFIQKPYSIEALRQKVKEALGE